MQYAPWVQNKKISLISEIFAGYTFRVPIKGVIGGLSVLQAKNITENILIEAAELTRIERNTSHTKAFAQSGDIAIGSRGIFRSGVIRTDHDVLASSSVYLLRIKDKASILPEYLAVYLNSAAGQKKLAHVLTTGTIRTLKKKDLEDIEIPVPSVDRQSHIVRLALNIKTQNELLKRKAAIQKNILHGILNQLEGSPS